jgi:hypothetical protein
MAKCPLKIKGFRGLELWLKWKSACFASVRLWVQTIAPHTQKRVKGFSKNLREKNIKK